MAAYKLYTRSACGLCEALLEQLLTECNIALADIELIDIDERPELISLYGMRIPVLEKAGIELGAGRLSAETLQALRQ